MLKSLRVAPLIMCNALLAMALPTHAGTAEVVLLDTPVKVTANIEVGNAGYAYAAQLGVHNGPIAQLVNTTVAAASLADVEARLRQQLKWRAPYLFVHSMCSSGDAWRCNGEVVFKVDAERVTRLGDLIGDFSTVYKQGHFFDVYDKLERNVDGVSHPTAPHFVIALDEVNGALTVNPSLTWSSNTDAWHEHFNRVDSTSPRPDWHDSEWEAYFSAVVNNAVLARYCNRSDELQQWLSKVEPSLDTFHRRALTDALSKVIPLEKPRAWRPPY